MNRTLIPWRRKDQLPARGRDAGTPFEALHRQMNELFESFFEDFNAPRLPSLWRGDEGLSVLTPNCEVAETEDEVKVTAELPGMEEKDIEVTLENNVLIVKGEKKEEREEKKKDRYFSERRYGHFQRMVPLPASVQEDKVKARFNQGVLTVTLPKTEESRRKGRKIEVAPE